eukprot:TRINITY_DN45352_c0_g1_i1.p1 TRINITY_DN45352_c0_g1~~TRINITY_DN45352_c0_g1_i1.p1  ORF type:complete len:908 (-),score=259.90 TRINITY_DN45352_c0_g1_i1:56-2482(-)
MPKATGSSAPVAAAAPAPAPVAEAPPAPAPKAAFTLADFCAGSASAKAAPKAASKAAAGRGSPYAATSPPVSASAKAGASDKGGPPKSLASLWSSEVDTKGTTASAAWDLGDGGNTLEEDIPDADDAAEWAKALALKAGASGEEGKQRASVKKSASAKKSAANKKAAAAPAEDMASIAAHGLLETQEALGESEGDVLQRGVHREGTGSKNVHLEGISLTLTSSDGVTELLKDADLHFQAGHVYGLVGKNGSGKTTLLRRLATRALPGTPKHLRFGYVAQELAALKADQTPLEAVVAGDDEREALLAERARLEALLDGAGELSNADAIAKAESIAERFAEVENRLELIEADAAEDRARKVLLSLDFDEQMIGNPMTKLSGGWRMRCALARALCTRPDVLMLDEPTNHLDLHGVLWLQDHLQKEFANKGLVACVVSHDRAFMDACVTDVVEIHNKKLRNYPGNYSDYLDRVSDEQRCASLAREAEEREEKNARKELSALKKKAREHHDDKKVSQLKSKQKKLEVAQARSREENGSRLSSQRDDRSDDIKTKLREDQSLRFKLPTVSIDTDANLLEMDAASIKRDGASILKNVTVTLDRGSRVAIVGGNGSGKSTLMAALAGELKAEEGPRGRGRRNVCYLPAYVGQNHLEQQASHMHGTCVDFLRSTLPDEKDIRGGEGVMTKQSDDSVLRAHLGNFGLGRDAVKKVGFLSGGQRARLSMAAAMSRLPSVLLLDEPTNHLDIDSLDALCLGLQSFEGAVVVVSHNRGFLEALCDELWVVQKGTVKACPKGEEAFSEFFAEYARSVQKKLR